MKIIRLSASMFTVLILLSFTASAQARTPENTAALQTDNDVNTDIATEENNNTKAEYIKYIDFNVTSQALRDAAQADIETYGGDAHCSWIDSLSLLAIKYGGDFSAYKKSDLSVITDAVKSGTAPSELTQNKKLFDYYTKAYGAVLGGMLGKYIKTEYDESGSFVCGTEDYGIRAFSPIARGHWYSHFDDFGASRSFGYRRPHLGHDLMGSVGAPVVCVESGYIEALGWNMYGGWRIGIRSFDGKRYYYYAHLRRNHPYNDAYEGKIVNAGEVIGYLGMTGYSSRENVNNINTPHLHIGLQIIFDESQHEGWNQIWVNFYELTKFLSDRTAPTYQNGDERSSRIYLTYDDIPD